MRRIAKDKNEPKMKTVELSPDALIVGECMSTVAQPIKDLALDCFGETDAKARKRTRLAVYELRKAFGVETVKDKTQPFGEQCRYRMTDKGFHPMQAAVRACE